MSSGKTSSEKPQHIQNVRTFGDEFKIYGTTFALDIFGGMNKSEKTQVVNLKIARKLPDTNRFDWNGDWIWVQVSAIEIAPMLSVLLGYKRSVSLEHYNEGVKKYFELRINDSSMRSKEQKDSSDSYVISMRTTQMGTARAVKIGDADRVRMSIFFFRAFMKNNGGVGQEVLYGMLKDIYCNEQDVVPRH